MARCRARTPPWKRNSQPGLGQQGGRAAPRFSATPEAFGGSFATPGLPGLLHFLDRQPDLARVKLAASHAILIGTVSNSAIRAIRFENEVYRTSNIIGK